MPLDEAQQRRAKEWLGANLECPNRGKTNLWTADLAVFPPLRCRSSPEPARQSLTEPVKLIGGE
jgi:hypothetical protein